MIATQNRIKSKAPKASASPAGTAAESNWSANSDLQPPGLQTSAFYAAGPIHALSAPVQASAAPVQYRCADCEDDINTENASSAAQTREDSIESPVQSKCGDCAEEPVQLWDCTEYNEPTCVQTKENTSELPVEPECKDCAEESVQLWNCTEYNKPTCVQTKEAAPELPVQSKCTACEAEKQVQNRGAQVRNTQMVRHAARSGLRNANQPLPHGERIQAAFGHHDVSHVRTSVGGSAGIANRRMGALAFTSGDRIGFRDAPSLRLAAHEATHVVQQREGLDLPGNVGRSGDRWERHADRVADAVASGRSAEAVLDEVAKPEAPSGGVGGGEASTPQAPAQAVQQQITSRASRLFDPSPGPAEVPEPAEEGGEELPEEAPGEPESKDRNEEESVLDAAKEGDSEAPPGVPADGAASVGGSSPASSVGATPAAGAAGPPASGPATGESPAPAPAEGNGNQAPETAAPGAEASGRNINAPCYRANVPPPPSNAPKPSSDNRGSEPEEQPLVTFGPWPDEVDRCDAEKVMTEGGQQTPAGLGVGEGPAADGGAAAGTTPVAAAGAESGGTSATATEEGAPSGNREVKAMSRAATKTADQSMTLTRAMDGQIARAEGERDAAVKDSFASTRDLGRVLARSQSLESGVAFPDAAGPQQFEARQAAIAETRDFMDRAAAQIAAAAAFAQEEVPKTLGATAESTKAGIQAAIETEKTAISDRIAQARAQARTGAAAARAHVNAEYATNAAVIESMTSAAIAALDATYTKSLDQVDEKETGGLEDVNSRFATGRTQHEAKGPEYADKAIKRGQKHVEAYEGCKVHPKTGVNYGDDGFWDGCLNVRRARAQQDAACKTAAGYKETFLRTAIKKGYDLIALRRKYRCAVIAGARQVNKTLDDTHNTVVSGLESGRMQALQGIAMARDENLAAVNSALAATLTSLSVQEFSQRQAVNDAGYLKQLAVEQLAHAGTAGLSRGISAAMDSLEQTLKTLSERFAQGDIPEPAALARSLAVTEASLAGGMGTLLGKMEENAQQAEAKIGEMGSAANEALLLITTENDELSDQAESGFAQQMDSLKAGASEAIGRLTANQVEQALKAMIEGTVSMVQAVAGFDKALGTIGGNVDGAIANSLQELNQDLTAKLGELDGQITTEAWKAAEKEQPAWKSVVAIVLIIVVIIAAAVISIVTLGAGASLFAVILVGALVGAVSGGLIQLINNWASGEAWHKGLAQAMIMGAIGGAIGGGLGYAGGALAAGAAQAGARAVTQLAITVGADLLSEGLTQTFGYVVFGQEFNWQGFVMAGAMSGVSFRAHPGGARPGVTTARAAGGAAGRRAAVTQVAGGAAVGFGVEYITSKIKGEKFDATKATSAAASGAVGARMARRGAAAGPAPEPTTRLGRAAERFRTFDPGGVGARLETRLQGLGGRLAGRPPEVGVPAGTRPPAAEETPTTRPPGEETTAARPAEEPSIATGRRPIDADTAAELVGPAKRMNEQDLIDATTTRQKVGDSEHDHRISREGPEICTACNRTKGHIENMLEGLPEGPLRTRGKALQKLVEDVETRLAQGKSGVDMINDSARIAKEFRAFAAEHPSIKRTLEDPRLFSTSGPVGKEVPTSTHLKDLDADVVRTKTIAASDFRSVPMVKGDQAIYVLRDKKSGAVLKVGIAKDNLRRVTQYSNAGKKLNLELELDVAIVQPRGGKTIRDIETSLRNRLEGEGHILPWDNYPSGRLGRSDRGTPFVHPVGKNLIWDEHGNLVQKGTGKAPPRTMRGSSSPEEVAQLLHEGLSVPEIAKRKGVHVSTVYEWRKKWATEIDEATERIKVGEQAIIP